MIQICNTNKMKKKTYHSWLDTGTSIKSGGVKLVLRAQT
jgi:hypothetical protein